MLVPESGLGKSAEANPTVYVYVPKLIASTQAEVTVNDGSEEVDSQMIALSEKEGIVKFPLLKKKPALAPEVTYTWSFSIICDSSDRSIDRYALGQIQHEPLTPTMQVELASKRTELDKASFFIDKDRLFWFDALNSLAKVHLQNQTDKNWETFLDSVNLSQIKMAKLIDLATDRSSL
jgi:hypothetical protein